MTQVERLTTGSLCEVLAQAAPALARGAVNVLSVAAIRDHSAERWPRKHEQVRAFVERAFLRASSPDAFIAPLNEVEFVVVHDRVVVPLPTKEVGLAVSVHVGGGFVVTTCLFLKSTVAHAEPAGTITVPFDGVTERRVQLLFGRISST